MDDHATKVALYRYGLIAPLLDLHLTPEERERIRREVLGRKHVIPGEEKAGPVSARSLRRWLRAYRKGGFAALKPQTRRDKGQTRRIDTAVLERAVALREAVPGRSVRQIIEMLALDPETPAGEGAVKPSTLARHFKRLGKTRTLMKLPKEPFRRYEKDRPNAQWQSDVWHGPYLPDPADAGRMRRTYLIAFLDDHSRLLTHAGFYWAEDLPSVLDCFKKALAKRGIPARVYCDNGAAYQSGQFLRICAELGIHHISARPYAPAGKGKIERFWQTVDGSFSPELQARPAKTLEELNALFAAWLEQGYHHWIHHETGETPVARFARALADIRLPDPVCLAEAFLWQEQRRVDKTGCVSIQGNRYEVDARLVGRTVHLRYDPFDLTVLQVWHEGERFPDAVPHQLVREHDGRVRPRPQRPAELPATGLSYLNLLLQKHEGEARAALGSIAFHKIQTPSKEDGPDV